MKRAYPELADKNLASLTDGQKKDYSFPLQLWKRHVGLGGGVRRDEGGGVYPQREARLRCVPRRGEADHRHQRLILESGSASSRHTIPRRRGGDIGNTMKVYMLWDMEGVSGLFTREQCWYWEPRAAPLAAKAQGLGLLMADVNVGLRRRARAGADEVIVCDTHHGGGNLVVDQMLARIPASPTTAAASARRTAASRWMPDSTRASIASCSPVTTPRRTPRAPSSHTAWSEELADFRINGRSVGEIGIESCFAGHWDVPFALVQGDAAVCAEAGSAFPGIVTAEVKRAIDHDTCEGLDPPAAHRLTAERIHEALAGSTAARSRSCGLSSPWKWPSACSLLRKPPKPPSAPASSVSTTSPSAPPSNSTATSSSGSPAASECPEHSAPHRPARATPCGGAECSPHSGGALVDVMKAAEHGPSSDRPRCDDSRWSGRLKLERLVGPVAVVEAGELRQHLAEVGLVQHDEVIEALSAEGPDDPLGDGVRRGARTGVSSVCTPRASARSAKSPPKTASRSRRRKRGRRPHAVASTSWRQHPGRGGMGGDVARAPAPGGRG